jgi:hypothetical protein
MLTKKNRVWAAAALLTVVVGFTSCLKNDNNITPTRPKAQVWFLNVSNSTVPASFYDNGQKISNDTTSINFNFYSNYAVLGGGHTFELRKKGGDSVISSSFANYDSTSYYTFIMYSNPVKSVTILSDLTSASSSKINIRCLNLSPNTDPSYKVDFYVGSEKIDSNRTFMSVGELAYATKFKQFSNFSINNTVIIKKAGTNEELARNNQLLIGSFQTNQAYTIYFAGTPGSTGKDKLMVNAFPNVY